MQCKANPMQVFRSLYDFNAFLKTVLYCILSILCGIIVLHKSQVLYVVTKKILELQY